MKRICVFCGSSSGAKPGYAESARHLAKTLLENGIGLVYGGASVGLMGILADSMLEGSGEVIGVIPKHLHEKELAHNGLSELRVVNSMHERKALMADLSDGFIALPGGMGTFEELCEILTWAQLGLHTKPVGILNINNYYSPLLQLFDQGVNEQFIRPQHRKMVLDSLEPQALIEQMRNYRPIAVPKWIKSNSET
jgi:uncharacterized protein (TIGR00730 family)